MLGKLAEPYVKGCKKTSIDHHKIHEMQKDVRYTQKKRMILITLFIRIFSLINTKVDEFNIRCVAEWAGLCKNLIRNIGEGCEGYAESMIYGLTTIRELCLRCSLRGYTTNQSEMIEHVRELRLCEKHKQKLDIGGDLMLAVLLDKAQRGQRLLHVHKVLLNKILKCKSCQNLIPGPVESLKTCASQDDCNMCELLVLDSIFAAIVYKNAPQRMFAVLSFSMDSRDGTLATVCQENNLTRWMSITNPKVTVCDLFFISGWEVSEVTVLESWLQRVLKKRHERSFYILPDYQIKKEHRHCTEPQMNRYILKLKSTILRDSISAVILEQTMCWECEPIVDSWSPALKQRLNYFYPYTPPSNTFDTLTTRTTDPRIQFPPSTFMIRMDRLIHFERLKLSPHHRRVSHYAYVSGIVSWVYPTAVELNHYYVSTVIAEGTYYMEQVSRLLVTTTQVYKCVEPTKLEAGYYRLQTGYAYETRRTYCGLLAYPNSGLYDVKRDTNEDHYIITSDHFQPQYIYCELDHKQLPKPGSYYISPIQGYAMKVSFTKVAQIHYKFRLPDIDEPEREKETNDSKREREINNPEREEETRDPGKEQDRNDPERKQETIDLEREGDTNDLEREEEINDSEREEETNDSEREEDTNDLEREEETKNSEREEETNDSEREEETNDSDREERIGNQKDISKSKNKHKPKKKKKQKKKKNKKRKH